MLLSEAWESYKTSHNLSDDSQKSAFYFGALATVQLVAGTVNAPQSERATAVSNVLNEAAMGSHGLAYVAPPVREKISRPRKPKDETGTPVDQAGVPVSPTENGAAAVPPTRLARAK